MLLFCSTFSAHSKELEVGIFDFPPYYVEKNNGHHTGTLVDVLKTVLNKAQLKYQIEAYPAKRLYFNLAEGKTNIFIGVKNAPEYEGKVLYSKKPVMRIQLCAFSIGRMPLLQSKEEIRGKEIIVVHGYSYAGIINYFKDPKNKIKMQMAPTHPIGFKMLLSKRANYLVDYLEAGNAFKAKHKSLDLKCGNLSTADLFIIVSKLTPRADKILEKMESHL